MRSFCLQALFWTVVPSMDSAEDAYDKAHRAVATIPCLRNGTLYVNWHAIAIKYDIWRSHLLYCVAASEGCVHSAWDQYCVFCRRWAFLVHDWLAVRYSTLNFFCFCVKTGKCRVPCVIYTEHNFFSSWFFFNWITYLWFLCSLREKLLRWNPPNAYRRVPIAEITNGMIGFLPCIATVWNLQAWGAGRVIPFEFAACGIFRLGADMFFYDCRCNAMAVEKQLIRIHARRCVSIIVDSFQIFRSWNHLRFELGMQMWKFSRTFRFQSRAAHFLYPGIYYEAGVLYKCDGQRRFGIKAQPWTFINMFVLENECPNTFAMIIYGIFARPPPC